MRTLIVAEGKHEHGGALNTLVCRLAAPRELECDQERLARNDIHAHHGKGQGYFKKAVRWMLEAQKQPYEAIVLVVDEDGKSQRRDEIDKAQASGLASIHRALGVAIRKFDAWMLADEQALTGALEITIDRQPDPEGIDDPKTHCQQLLRGNDCTMSQTQLYSRMADLVDLERVAQRCPMGFRPFAQRVREL